MPHLNEFLIGMAIGIAVTSVILILLHLFFTRKKAEKAVVFVPGNERPPETTTQQIFITLPHDDVPLSVQKFSITRREIADDTLKLNDPNITVKERPDEPQLPMSLNYKGFTYAMLHGTEAGVVMIVKIADAYAAQLALRHPEICRARFPRGPNWYYLPIDYTFRDKESVYEILGAARAFVDLLPHKPTK